MLMMMNIGMYGMCNTTDSFSSYVGSGSHHHHQPPYNSDMAPAYTSATTPPEQTHYHYYESYPPPPLLVSNNHTSSTEPTPSSPTTNSDHHSSYYAQTSTATLHHSQQDSLHQDENVIITSDNGLSYTNLDYSTGNPTNVYQHQHNPPPHSQPEHMHHTPVYAATINYTSKNHSEEIVHHTHESSHQHEEIVQHHLNHHHHHHHLNHQESGYNVAAGGTNSYLHHVPATESGDTQYTHQTRHAHQHQSSSPLSSEYQPVPGTATLHRHYKEEPCHSLLPDMHQATNGVMMTGGAASFHHHALHPLHHQNAHHHHHHHHHLIHQQHTQQTVAGAMPTYKWMQVKRNVPKPAGRAKQTRCSQLM